MGRKSAIKKYAEYSTKDLLQSMEKYPALTEVYSSLAGHAGILIEDEIKFYYNTGLTFAAVQSDTEAYGEDGYAQLMAALRYSVREARDMQRFSEAYDQDDLMALCAMENEGVRLTWGHIRAALVGYLTNEQRAEYFDQALKGKLTAKQLQKLIKEEHGDVGPSHGRSHNKPDSAQAWLDLAFEQLKMVQAKTAVLNDTSSVLHGSSDLALSAGQVTQLGTLRVLLDETMEALPKLINVIDEAVVARKNAEISENNVLNIDTSMLDDLFNNDANYVSI